MSKIDILKDEIQEREGLFHWTQVHEWIDEVIEELKLKNNQAKGQIQEAISILESGTDYEKLHLIAILKDGLK